MQTLIETLNNPTDDGLYSLKALAKTSGKWDTKKPSQFLRLQSTIDEIKFLSSAKSAPHDSTRVTKVIKTEKTANGGGDTLVCRDLVYSYAQWISPEFKFLVIRTFDDLLNATTAEQVLAVKFKLDNESQADLFTKAQQPRDKNTLQVILKCTPFQAEQFHNELICDGMLEKIGSKTITQRILGTTIKNKMVTGKKGDTLLWDTDALKDYFDGKQKDWTK